MTKEWVDYRARVHHKKRAEEFRELMDLAQKISDKDQSINALEALKRASELLKELKEDEQK